MSVDKPYDHLEEQVLKTLLYFDIFSYPLRASEILKFLRFRKTCQQEVVECLKSLTEKQHVFRFGDLYSLHADQKNIKRRLKGNAEAEKWMKVAEKKARFIARFPFVRAVMASGSLSKGYMDEKSDLDFFIVTAPGCLWIARTTLVMYKRLFLHNSHKEFCVNYFVDTDHLEIEEKNLFTATELATLVPLYNHSAYQAVISSNPWVKEIFPNLTTQEPGLSENKTPPLFQKLSEVILFPFAKWLDRWFLRVSLRRWLRLYGASYTKKDFEIAFKSKRHVSKNHPNHFQKKVLDRYQRKLTEFQNRFTQLPTYE